jgi:hypothetical protein
MLDENLHRAPITIRHAHHDITFTFGVERISHRALTPSTLRITSGQLEIDAQPIEYEQTKDKYVRTGGGPIECQTDRANGI